MQDIPVTTKTKAQKTEEIFIIGLEYDNVRCGPDQTVNPSNSFHR